MTDWSTLALAGAIVTPTAATAVLRSGAGHERRIAAAACAASVALSLASHALPGGDGPLSQLVALDRLTGILVPLYAGVGLLALLLAPARDLARSHVAASLVVVAGTLLAMAAAHPIVLAAGWTLSAAPFLAGPFTAAGVWRPRVALFASCVAATVGCVAMTVGQTASPFGALAGTQAGGTLAFASLAMAVVLRKGLLPAHAWIPDVTTIGALPASLLINGHLGAVVLARVLLPVHPDAVLGAHVLLSDLALLTAAYAAIRAVSEPDPQRVIALLAMSQAACIFAGLESDTVAGETGAALQLAVVALATTALFGVLRSVEARRGALSLEQYQGLGHVMPRLAVAFLLCALTLLGLPGTLGFWSSELLVHGTLTSHPQLGVLLPAATALNAICLFRVFSRLFLGRRIEGSVPLDALRRERWALTAVVLLLVLGGVWPRLLLSRLHETPPERHAAIPRAIASSAARPMAARPRPPMRPSLELAAVYVAEVEPAPAFIPNDEMRQADEGAIASRSTSPLAPRSSTRPQ